MVELPLLVCVGRDEIEAVRFGDADGCGEPLAVSSRLCVPLVDSSGVPEGEPPATSSEVVAVAVAGGAIVTNRVLVASTVCDGEFVR